MPPTTWKLTVADGSERSGLTTAEARDAITALMRGGTPSLPIGEPAPDAEPRVERTREPAPAAAERALVAV